SPPGARREAPSSMACGALPDMSVPIAYIARNLFARKLTTLLTAGGMALVVYVFATVLMLAAGLQETLVATGSDDNVVVIRRASPRVTGSSSVSSMRAAPASIPRYGATPSRCCRRSVASAFHR